MLPDGGISKHTLRHEHLMRRLEDPLEVRRVALGEGKLLSELIQADTPGEATVGPGNFEEPVQATRDG